MHNICAGLLQPPHMYALAVHGNVAAFHMMALVNGGYFLISRIFHTVNVLKAQQLNQNSVKIFRSRPHDNLFRMDRHSPKILQMPGNGLAQRKNTAAGRVFHQGKPVVSDYLPHDFGPDRKWKSIRMGLAAGKIGKAGLFLRVFHRLWRRGSRKGGPWNAGGNICGIVAFLGIE